MRINGVWLLCEDGIVRPVLRGEVLAGDGSWVKVDLQVDTAADRTVFSSDILTQLALPPAVTQDSLMGVGGLAASVLFDTQLRLTDTAGQRMLFHGRYAAVTGTASLDMSLLGRAIIDLFALLVDRPRNAVCLLGQRHVYTIEDR